MKRIAMPFHDDCIRFPRGGAQEKRRRKRRPLREQRDLVSVMNNTRWRKLRAAMLALAPSSPSYRIQNVENGDLTGWDGEWFYHFDLPSYAYIEWLDLKARSPALRGVLHEPLKRLRVPGEETPEGFRTFGYSRTGRPLDYIR
jgi:hypothetical protein